MAPQTIYIDEAGFTGGNLLDRDQSELVFAAVAISEADAAQIWSEVAARSNSQAQELKGSNLTGRPRGRAAITWLLENTADYTKLMASNKRYALAGKFFEYIFEPVLADKSRLFYAMDFHRFVAMALYFPVAAGYAYAAHIFENFQSLARDPGSGDVTNLYPSNEFQVDEQDPLHHMLTFALCHKNRIEAELKDIHQSQTYPGWALELSSTSVHCLLAGWGEKHDALRVYCDDSKPIADSRELFDAMVGRQDKFYPGFGTHGDRSVIYNLSEPIQFVDSKQFPGIQIADIWASSLAYALRHRDDEICQRWLEIAEPAIDTVIVPETQLIDLDDEGPLLNWALLLELSRRSVSGESVTIGIEDYIYAARYSCTYEE